MPKKSILNKTESKNIWKKIFNNKNNRIYEVIFVLLLFLLAFYVRLIPFEINHYWDESVYLQHAEIFIDGRTNYSELDCRPPFLSLLIAFFYLFWHNMFMAQIVISLLNASGIIALYYLIKKLSGWKIAVMGSLLFAITSFVVDFSHYVLTDAPCMSLIVISLLFFYSALNNFKQEAKNKKSYTDINCIFKNTKNFFTKQNIYFFASGFIFALAILTKFTTMFFAFLFLFLYYLHKNEIKFFKVFYFGAGLALPILIYMIISQIVFGFFLTPFLKAQAIIAGSPSEPWFFYIFHAPSTFSIFVLIGFFIGILFLLIPLIIDEFKYFKFKIFNKDLFVFFLFFLIFFIYMSIMTHKEERYLFPVFFIVYWICGHGIINLINIISKNKLIRLFLFFLIICLIFLINFSSLNIKFNESFIHNTKTDTLLLADFLNAQVQENETVYTMTNYPVLAYYSGKKVRGIYTSSNIFNCSLESFEGNWIVPKNGYLIFLITDIYEKKYIDHKSMENCSFITKINQIDNWLVYKFN